MKIKLLIPMALLLTALGCNSCAGAKMHPGSANAFDSTTADTLLDTQNVLEGLSAKVSEYPKAIAPLNEARSVYTVWKNDYLLWRCASGFATTLGPQGAPCPTGNTITQAQVQADQTKTQSAIATVQAIEGAKK